MSVHTFQGQTPRVGDNVFIAPGAHVIGDVELGADVSVWFNSVIRGDVMHIRIGARTNIQDNSVVHVTSGRHPTLVANDVVVGHRAILHGCTVEQHCLIGMGAVLMDRVVIGEYSIVGAGALVTEGTAVPPGSLILGSPAKVRRTITDKERAHLEVAASQYVELAKLYA